MGTEVDFVSLVPLAVSASPMQSIPETVAQAFLTCPSAGECISIGLDASLSDSKVTVITGGVPGPLQVVPGAVLVALSCTAPTSCFAVGESGGVGVIAPITDGVVGPLEVVPETTELDDITCSSATSCVAVGTNGVVVAIDDGVVGPAQIVPGAQVFWNVACGSPTSCVAAGGGTDGKRRGGARHRRRGRPGAERRRGVRGGGHRLSEPHIVRGRRREPLVPELRGLHHRRRGGPPQLVSEHQAGLGPVACSDASHCVAVGDTLGDDNQGAVVSIVDGVPGPLQTVPGTNFLRSVACTTSCVAVGVMNVAAAPFIGAIVPISGGVAGSAQYASGAGYLFEVACGAGGCTAVGQDASGTVGGFLTLGPGAKPTLSTVASPSTPVGGSISDTAIVAGGSTPTGTVTFSLYAPGDDTCSSAIWSTTVPLGAGGVASSGDVEASLPGTYHWVATYGGDLDNLQASSACGDESVVITPKTLGGRAYGLSANATLLGLPLVDVSPTPDTGDVETTTSEATSVPCVASVSGLVHARDLCASVTTTASPAGSTAVASAGDLSLSIATLPAIAIGAVEATSTSSCSGATGSTTIASLKIGGTVVIGGPTAVAPNTHVTVGPIALVLNEQIVSPTGGLTVNGVHLRVNGGGLAHTDIVVSSAESNVGNCP